MTIDHAAEILYLAFNRESYGRGWTTAPAKPQWRIAAQALIEALEK